MPRTRTVLLTALTLLASAAPARALVVNFELSAFTGDPAFAQVSVDDAALAGKIKITVDVIPSPQIGDIRGVFFDLDAVPAGLALGDILGSDVTDRAFNTANLGGGVNLNPHDPFHVGVEIGTAGIGFDDFQSTMFTVADKGVLDANSFMGFGVRLTSVGVAGSSRGGSSKLLGDPTPPVPEPATVVLLAGGLIAAGLRRRRR
jgi:hypothetical protein